MIDRVLVAALVSGNDTVELIDTVDDTLIPRGTDCVRELAPHSRASSYRVREFSSAFANELRAPFLHDSRSN